ncbi:MAG TPA: GWxTD domain-containing protein [Gemmatimonadota bacterium]|nr:GWxTD domain-containing protein [Gemmatimonadota bacterium]
MFRTHLIAGVALGAALLAPDRLPAQFVDDFFEPIPAVPESGLYPPEVQQSIEEGYRQLALVTDPSDDAHLEPAKAAFQRALDVDPRALHAWVGKGIYELKKDEQWLVLLESIKKIFNRDHISMAQKAFEEALEIDPAFHVARYDLALAHRQARGPDNYRRAIRELERLVREAPGFGDTPLLLAITYRDAGDLEKMRESIDSLPEEGFPPATRQLLLTYALANLDRPAEAAAAYDAGLAAISTDREAGLYWHDIKPIVSGETDAEFQSLPAAEKADLLRRYWERLADQAFVSVEERLVEHYRRLHHAYQNYRILLPERRHYSGMAAYVPPWQTGFDDRGVIYLRHGPPDDVATFSGPQVERNVSWKYERADGDPLVFHFVSDEDVADYKLVRRLSDAVMTGGTSMAGTTMFNQGCGSGRECDSYDARILSANLRELQELYSSRGHLSPVYDRAATRLDPQILQAEEGMLAEDIAVGTGSQSYDPETAGEPLLFPVYPVAFKDPGETTSIHFYYALPTALVSIATRPDGGSTVDYRYQLLVHDEGSEPVERQQQDVTLSTSQPIPRDAGAMLPGVRSARLGPGQYQYGMKVTDLTSGRFGVVQGQILVDDLVTPDLAMSGVVLAHSVAPASGDGAFVRWGRYKVLPLPSRMFRRSQPVFVYYEVYGLDLAPSGGASYRTTYTLAARDRGRNVVARFFSAVGERLFGGEERGAITYSFERSQPGAADPLLEYFSLDVSDSPPGEYTLRVEIEDLAGGNTVRREVPLTLVQ